MIDIAIPLDNEEEFIKIAEKLGYEELLFLYDFDEYMAKQRHNNAPNPKIKIKYGLLATEKNIQKISSKFRNETIFLVIKSSTQNREIIEKSQVNLIFALEETTKRDFMHQRGSGLDHITAKLASEHNIIVGFSLNSVLNSENKHIILGRMMQNIMLCRKYKVKTIIASFAQSPSQMRSPYDIMSLLETLGMHHKEAKDSLKIN